MENVLFIFTDQWQFEALGYHGHKVVKTPNLDKLAKNSTDFLNSYTVCPLCTPARGSMFTGLYPHQSGVIDNCDVGGSTQEYLPKEAYTWIDAMIDSGRKTGYFGKWHLGLDWQENKENIEFDILRVESDREKHINRKSKAAVSEKGQFLCKDDPKLAKKHDDMYSPFYGKLDSIEERFDYKVTERSLRFLEENKESPWCLTVSLVGPHFPNLNPEPYYSMYDDVDIELPKSINDSFVNKPWFHARRWWPSIVADHFDEKEWKKTIRAYYGSITIMDHLIGRVLDKAKECSGGRVTKVIFTSDHGEMAGSHGKFDKHAYHYEEVMRTPLIICEDLNGKQNCVKRDEFCNTLDIANTFFAITNEPCENGRDLILNTNADYIDNSPKEVFSNYYKYNGHSFEVRTVRTQRYKYSFVPQDIDELYDLEKDPYELNNLSDDFYYQEIKKELKAKVTENMKKTDDYLLEIIDDLPQAGKVGLPEYPKLKLNY